MGTQQLSDLCRKGAGKVCKEILAPCSSSEMLFILYIVGLLEGYSYLKSIKHPWTHNSEEVCMRKNNEQLTQACSLKSQDTSSRKKNSRNAAQFSRNTETALEMLLQLSNTECKHWKTVQLWGKITFTSECINLGNVSCISSWFPLPKFSLPLLASKRSISILSGP